MNKDSLLNSESQIKQIVDETDQSSSTRKLITSGFGLGVLFVAVVALAFSPVFTKLSELEISPTATIFNRLWIAAIIVSCWRLIKTPPELKQIRQVDFKVKNLDYYLNHQLDYKATGLLVLASLSATVSAIAWAISFTHTSVASSTLLRSLTPIFISFGAWLILKQQFDQRFLVGMVLSIVGGIMIGWDDLYLGSEHLFGDGIALLSAALHGANILIVGYLRDRGRSTTEVLLWRCGFGALIALPVVYFTHTQLFPTSTQGWLMVIALAVICQTFGQGLLVYSLKYFSSSFVGIFALLKPIITALLAWIIFAEHLNVTSGIAVVLILAGIYLAKPTVPTTVN